MLASTVAFITRRALCAAMFHHAASGFVIHEETLLVLTLSITWYGGIFMFAQTVFGFASFLKLLGFFHIAFVFLLTSSLLCLVWM